MSSIPKPCPIIPPELIDYTIDFLHSDTLTLRACALTCQAWLPSSRFHLFGTITIGSEKILNHFLDLVRSEVALARGRHGGESVLGYVRTLAISKPSILETASTSPSAHIIEYTPWETSIPQRLSSLGDASTLFPSLHTLHFKSFQSFWQPNSFFLSSFASPFKSPSSSPMKCIRLENSSLRSLEDVVELLGRLGSVDSLWLDNVSFGRSSFGTGLSGGFLLDRRPGYGQDSVQIGITRPPSPIPVTHSSFEPTTSVSLKSFRIDGYTKPLTPLFNWILSTKSSDTLRSLSFTKLDGSDVEDLDRFLEALGESIEHLTIGFREGDDSWSERTAKEGVTDTHLSLHSNTSLRSLTIASTGNLPLKKLIGRIHVPPTTRVIECTSDSL